jgi:hypothetical protein
MDRYAPRDQRRLVARHEAIWNAIAMSDYLAPARIASDDSREQALIVSMLPTGRRRDRTKTVDAPQSRPSFQSTRRPICERRHHDAL